jgi:hypothetical protein
VRNRPAGKFADDIWWRRIDAAYGELDGLKSRLRLIRGGRLRRLAVSLGLMAPGKAEETILQEIASTEDDIAEMKRIYGKELDGPRPDAAPKDNGHGMQWPDFGFLPPIP